MLNIVLKIIKKLIFGMILLFGYNIFLSSLNIMIPINIITILIASLFDVPGMIGMVIFLLVNF